MPNVSIRKDQMPFSINRGHVISINLYSHLNRYRYRGPPVGNTSPPRSCTADSVGGHQLAAQYGANGTPEPP